MLPKTLAFPEAALAEPLACAIHAVDIVGIREGETALVIGAGPMSLLLISALAARGARVYVLGRNRGRLDTAISAGATTALDAQSADWPEVLRQATAGRGPDCVFEAVGKPETWAKAVEIVRKGGRICFFGGCASGTFVPIDAHRVHYDQLTLQGVFHHTPKYFRAAVELLAAGNVNTKILIAGSIALTELCAHFDSRHNEPTSKVAVIP